MLKKVARFIMTLYNFGEVLNFAKFLKILKMFVKTIAGYMIQSKKICLTLQSYNFYQYDHSKSIA
jgi:hypothetical protein